MSRAFSVSILCRFAFLRLSRCILKLHSLNQVPTGFLHILTFKVPSFLHDYTNFCCLHLSSILQWEILIFLPDQSFLIAHHHFLSLERTIVIYFFHHPSHFALSLLTQNWKEHCCLLKINKSLNCFCNSVEAQCVFVLEFQKFCG